jgi:hypothetical protein
MHGKHKSAIAVSGAGVLLAGAHAALGAVGVMTVAQWSSGAAIGLVIALIGGVWFMHGR